MKEENKLRHIVIELGTHLPYSIFGVLVGVVILGLLTFFATILEVRHLLPRASEELFHVFHPAHVLLSAVVTTAMFWKHERRLVKTLFVGFFGSIVICGLSDILLPYIGGKVLWTSMDLHVCLFEHPGIIIPFAFIGVMVGLLVPGAIEKSTEFSHSIHVLVSSMASILYLISFGATDWIRVAGGIFLITIIAVMIPCCLSDIAFPLFFVDSRQHKH